MRSGKSRLAEQLAARSGFPVTYVATATAGDAEMRRRIEMHRARRPKEWELVEAPFAVAKALRAHAGPERALIVDCMTLWLTSLLMAADSDVLTYERAELLAVLPSLAGEIILVSNETGLGIVPQGELSRRFCDEAGMLHQALAARCERVVLTVAGLPHVLKGMSL